MTASSLFGPYEIRSLLGRGGMGEVYEAFDREQNRLVALKLLPAALLSDVGFVERFRRESFAAAQLNDPHVIPIHRYGEIDGRLYLDMRLVRGLDLGALLQRDGALPPERTVPMIAQAADALDAAHAANLIHRDVKPSNLLVTERDFVYLVDFGIAHTFGMGTTAKALTATGAAIGTLDYMAPERFIGRSDIDSRADVYSLACVLYECLTGQRPFPVDGLPALLYAHLNTEPPRVTAVRPELPAAVDDVVARGMAKEPDQRYFSAGELAQATAAALNSSPAERTFPTAATAPTVLAPITMPALPMSPSSPASGPTPRNPAPRNPAPTSPTAAEVSAASVPPTRPPGSTDPAAPPTYPAQAIPSQRPPGWHDSAAGESSRPFATPPPASDGGRSGNRQAWMLVAVAVIAVVAVAVTAIVVVSAANSGGGPTVPTTPTSASTQAVGPSASSDAPTATGSGTTANLQPDPSQVTQTVSSAATTTITVTPSVGPPIVTTVSPGTGGPVALAPPDQSPVLAVDASPYSAGGDYATFNSPSGAIRCGVAPTGARCSIASFTFSPPPMPAGQACSSPWGSVLDLSDQGSGTIGCRDAAGLGGRVLEYGTSLTEGRYTCESRSTGMTCTDGSTGHFFWVSSGAYLVG